MKYFVSYFATLNTEEQCWGNCTIERDHPIDSPDEYKSMEQLMCEEFYMKQATIMYWRRLEEAE